jgi:hypothetical protein
MVIDRGNDFPRAIQTKLDCYGSDMWLYRDHPDMGTTRAINTYKGDHRGYHIDLYTSLEHTSLTVYCSFDYLTPRIRITSQDLVNTKLAEPNTLHVICSPSRAACLIRQMHGWLPIVIYEPIPVCSALK